MPHFVPYELNPGNNKNSNYTYTKWNLDTNELSKLVKFNVPQELNIGEKIK